MGLDDQKAVLGMLVALIVLTSTGLGLRWLLGPMPPAVQIHSSVGQLKDWLVERSGQISSHLQTQYGNLSCADVSRSHCLFRRKLCSWGSPDVLLQGEFPALVGAKIGVQAINLARPSIDSHDILSILESFKSIHLPLGLCILGTMILETPIFFSDTRAGVVQQRQV